MAQELNSVLSKVLKEREITIIRECFGIGCHEKGLEEIGDRAFSLCSALKSITLPSTIRLLGQNIFAGSSVSEAHFNGTMAEWLKYVEKPRTRSAPWIRLDEVICTD
jgi:hypothetical protein